MTRQAPVAGGTLYLVGTPIGNLEDMTYRAVRVLREVELVAAEDTRSAQILFQRYQITTPLTSCFEGNETQKAQQLGRKLVAGSSIALISEAGMPGISDPGHRLLTHCLSLGVAVDVIPGPSAVLTGVLLSGFAADRFRYLGFVPRQQQQRKQLWATLEGSLEPIVLFESPARLAHTLRELAGALADRSAAIVREMTKVHQETIRGPLCQLAARVEEERLRGEITLVIGPAETSPLSPLDIEHEVKRRLDAGQRPKEIAAALAAHSSRRQVYQLALRLASKPDDPLT
jgi:16S rRNA (cytidine1402-2'-O)-methyltransferase